MPIAAVIAAERIEGDLTMRLWIRGTLGAAIGFVSILLVVGTLLGDGTAPPMTAFSVIAPVRENLAQLQPAQPAGLRVVLLADSTMMHGEVAEAGGAQLHAALAFQSRGSAAPRVVSLVHPGLDLYEYWALADLVADAAPDQVVLALNLRSFDRVFRTHQRRAELVGWIDPQRLPEAFVLPLRQIGMSADRALLYVGIVQARLDGLWARVRGEQARLGSAWAAFSDAPFGPRGETPGDMEAFRAAAIERRLSGTSTPSGRYDRGSVATFYATSLAGLPGDPPELAVLRALLRRFERADVPVLVYIVPVNREYFASLGFETRGLDDTAARLRALAEDEGARLLDLHDLLPDARFSDPVHFKYAGARNGIRPVARSLARALTSPD